MRPLCPLEEVSPQKRRISAEGKVYTMEQAMNVYQINARLKFEREAKGISLEHPLATIKRLIRKMRLSRYWQLEDAKMRASFLRVIKNLVNGGRPVTREREAATGGPASSAGPGDDDEEGVAPWSDGLAVRCSNALLAGAVALGRLEICVDHLERELAR